MATLGMHEPDYRRELGDGLVLRWSTARDIAGVAQLYSFVFRDSPELPLNHYITAWTEDLMHGKHPLCGPGEFGVVEDTRSGAIVAASGLMRQSIVYEDITLPFGRPEIVASHPDYRNRGLVRAIFEIIHARSDTRGDLVQGITGIPYYYRLFGYEYALDLGGGRRVPFTAIPALKAGEVEAFGLRDATLDDIPQILALYDRERARAAISTPIDPTYWRWLLDGQRPESGEGWNFKMIVNNAGETVGYTMPRRLRWGERVGVTGLAVLPGISLSAVLPAVMRALRAYGETVPGWVSEKEPPPANSLYFNLGAAHPVYQLLSTSKTSQPASSYAWYIRVPDLPALLLRIAPVLERRLADSALAYYTGELKLDFYRSGLRLEFTDGRLTTAEPWRSQVWGAEANAGFPPLVFLQLLFGRRSMDDLRRAYDDVWANDPALALLEALFPPRLAFALPLD